MKRTALLNRHLSALIATLGHGDRIVVADAGLPVPPGVPVIDLAVTAGVPRFDQVLQAIRAELVIEGIVWAQEASADLTRDLTAACDGWAADQGRPIARSTLTHEAFKESTANARAIIRTGEVTPYANVILISGVAF
ncbi:D-ribose pyranase [Loktanella salsilacus]|jgi:D-ribose pyranase|uniref:D-ribose pyranase n=1 Tax=Loktanella salsilacus TaxID=195913 RepID=UPI00356351D5|tara:strand:- start:438 stop:848 length:411 start_codon:yes stop_codon:yes gene_type:complete